MGITRPGDMGFDIVHFNLHKSFTQPHGGGGPGARPDRRVRADGAVPACVPRIVRARTPRRNGAGSTFDLDYDHPKSIGRLRGFQGNYGCFVRAYAYICSLGAEGLRDASETAVLNANYLLARLRELGVAEQLPLAFGELCMHEFVLSGAPMKRDLEVRTLDLAKRLLDHGFHPPTVYFPLIVDEALLIEPTETETRETLDAFADALAAILREAAEDPEIARNAPYTTPVRRLDEAGAAKRPVIRQPLDEAWARAPSRGRSALGGGEWARPARCGVGGRPRASAGRRTSALRPAAPRDAARTRPRPPATAGTAPPAGARSAPRGRRRRLAASGGDRRRPAPRSTARRPR